jgi:hypothetical protein
MNEPERKQAVNLPRVRIQAVVSLMWCAMGAIEGGHAITVGVARPTLETRKGHPCMG